MTKLSGGSLFVCCTKFGQAGTCELKMDLKSALGAIPSQLDGTHTVTYMQWRYYKHFFHSRDQDNKKLQFKFKVQIFMYSFGSTHCVGTSGIT